MDVIQVGVKYGNEIPGCSRMGSAKPDSIWEYLTLRVMSLHASVLEYMASRMYLSVEIPSSVRRSKSANPPSSGGPCLIAVGSLDEYPSFCSMDFRTFV